MHLITNIKQKAFLLFIPMLLAASFFSCTKDDEVAIDNKTLIIGKWNLTHETVKQISNGATIRDEESTDLNGAYYQFNADNTITYKVVTGDVYNMNYSLVGDSLTFIHTQGEHKGHKEFLWVKKLTNTEMHLSYLPKQNEPYLEAPNGTYIEWDLKK